MSLIISDDKYLSYVIFLPILKYLVEKELLGTNSRVLKTYCRVVERYDCNMNFIRFYSIFV